MKFLIDRNCLGCGDIAAGLITGPYIIIFIPTIPPVFIRFINGADVIEINAPRVAENLYNVSDMLDSKLYDPSR
jgi:hypothetical protein